ncbi:MAG: spheroidene monooxygenase [Rhodobacteraceae bacterium]|nr:spheroidene monooxygenase [Paracoccaceae bacterium]
MQTVSFSLYRFAGPGARLWAFTQMLLARPGLARTPDIGFWKLLGSGTGEGFTPRPNTAVYAILATWPDLATARRQVRQAPVFRRHAARACESWTVYLGPASARGHWSGQAPFQPGTDLPEGPVAALTRATIRPSVLLRFWGRVPAISAVIGANRDVAFKIGVGEVPWLHQVTFSIWPDTDSMARFARHDGPHARAIRAVREEGWFSEELYARFRILDAQGTWAGGDPLSALRSKADIA